MTDSNFRLGALVSGFHRNPLRLRLIETFSILLNIKMCGGLSCAVVGFHCNGNKIRNSFKVLVLHTRKPVMSGAVCMACSD